MWSMSHPSVHNLCSGENLSIMGEESDIFWLSHTSKFAPIGDMWKNHCN